jgi:hypothetical protein
MSMGRFVQGMLSLRETLSKGCIVHGTLRPGIHRPVSHHPGTDRPGIFNNYFNLCKSFFEVLSVSNPDKV